MTSASRLPMGEERLPSDAFPASRVVLATRLSSRMRGLLFSPASDDLMVLMPCHDIHTFGMSHAIDVAFLDANGTVVRTARDVLPNKRLRHRGAAAVVERRAIPRELWFEEGDCIELGQFRRAKLPAMPACAEDASPG
ncbi:MAG: DUF192 domain-containing protein [Coriobacteriia bacterium]|nr:DUF192 domain-containing protein [Coriobacteriia bacterium]